ncbi:MAG: DUF2723 domain-containing protein [Bacteroidia bacterium]|nr:DUF2723 domain-containing protein [Bacteroidia bacterium]
MKYSRINTLAGWAIFVFALVTYLLTMAPTASFWDCGEFIACANELEVPHPPGAPFFLLLGRIFAMLAGGPERVAFMLNFMSVLSSAFTVLFTFWITTHLARKLIGKPESEMTLQDLIAVIAAGAVGALACTFADSFWFNSVEAEVYALSSFFTAVVVWLMFKWENRADEPGSERWLLLIAYLMGLSIGVHLLNLLAIPALAFIYYFRKYSFSWGGFILTGAISVAILGVIQSVIIINTFDLAWWMERIFVGVQKSGGVLKTGMGLPIGSGLVIFFLLLFGGLAFVVWYSAKRSMLLLNTASLAVIVIYIGFASYMMIPIRSGANSPIDENNPENTQTFISYMKREQYGDRPLIRGPLYNANPVNVEVIGKEYVLEAGADRYTEIGDKREYVYNSRDEKWFPRMYDRGKYTAGPHAYINYVRNKGSDQQDPSDDKPTAGEDLKFFWNYQVIHMYWRYFMWNFAGRESDIQDTSWESGLNIARTSKMPDFMKRDVSKNHYFLIPFLLGVLGLGWQARARQYDAAVIGLLFFFTGLAIIIYLNQNPMQPRERDYSFAGSIQTFAIWVGLGVIALYQLLQRFLKQAAVYAAAAIGLAAPAVMAAQNWFDHSRANNYVAPDSAWNLLNSVAPNAVLFTNGDNDTFPLWYLQEVEGVRTDVRVLCLSYVNTDWYIDQMKMKVNQSEPLPISLKRQDYVGQVNQARQTNRELLSFSLPADAASLLASGIIAAEDTQYVESPMAWQVRTRGAGQNRYLELKDLLVLNLLENVAKEGWGRPVYFANTVTPDAMLQLEPYLHQEGLAYRILPVKKPVAPDPMEPTTTAVNLAKMDSALTVKFRYRNLDRSDIYYDENIQRMVSNYHESFFRLADEYLLRADALERGLRPAQPGGSDGIRQDIELTGAVSLSDQEQAARYRARAREVLEFQDRYLPYQTATPFHYMIIRNATLHERMGDSTKAGERFEFAKTRTLETLKYYSSIGEAFPRAREYYFTLQLLQQHYTQQGRAEEAAALATEMATLDRRKLGLQ